MKRLPIGIQTYSEIINEGYLYIDKTPHILRLVNNYKYAFLSRPRRFGKSLLIDTIANIFKANKELFKAQYIYNHWDWENEAPVIQISMSSSNSIDEIKADIEDNLKNCYQTYKIEFQEGPNAVIFSNLIRLLNQKFNQRVTILIDEYDKPILDNINKPELAEEARLLLNSFYSQIKKNDSYINFTLITGVSKFSKTSIFSGLNNMEDISLNPKFSSLCGYTQEEIDNKILIEEYAQVNKKQLKTWYNGFNFMGDLVYNPFDVLLFLKNNFEYKSYWFETGTPSFLMSLIKKQNFFIPQINKIKIEEQRLNNIDIENMNIESILFQTGYLTIKSKEHTRNKIIYSLGFPNLEIETSFMEFLSNFLIKPEEKYKIEESVVEILENLEFKKLKIQIEKLFANIAYNNFSKNEIANYEGFYASVLYSFLSSLGFNLIAEDVTNKGRIDLCLKTDNSTFLFEFKVSKSKDALTALNQIKNKNYAQKYRGDIYIVGINFNPEIRNIDDLKWEKL